MQWDASEHAGFTTGTPWIPANPNHTEINAEAAVADPDSVFHHYRRLVELRHDEPAVAHGDFAMLLPEHPQVYAFTRTLGDRRLLVLVNMSGRPAAVELPDPEAWAGAESLLTNLLPGEEQSADGQLAPWEARVLRRVGVTVPPVAQG